MGERKLRLRRRGVLAICIGAVALAVVPAAHAHADIATITAATTQSTPKIDGVINATEWSSATQFSIPTNSPADSPDGTGYAMTDGAWLYLAYTVPDPTFTSNTLIWVFDDDHDGVREQGDEALISNIDDTDADDFYDAESGFWNIDSAAGGTDDLNARATYTAGVVASELRHPLCSADTAHDFCLAPGALVGFHFQYWGGTFFTGFPSPSYLNPPTAYGDMAISLFGDTTAPNTDVTSGPAGTTTSTTATFSFVSNEPGATFECRLDGGAYSACTSPKSYEGLAIGAHTFETRAVDGAGNTDATPETRSWTVAAASYDVNTTDDAVDMAGCDATHCSLREAIAAANGAAGADTITFSIGSGRQTIKPTSALPTITEAVQIQGQTQEGFLATPLIELDGSLTPGSIGLVVHADDVIVRHLAIFGFHNGIEVAGTSIRIVGTWVGLDGLGVARGNANIGVAIRSGSFIEVGGGADIERSIVSASGGNGIVIGSLAATVSQISVAKSYVGTNSTGTAAVPNALNGILVNPGSSAVSVVNSVVSGNTGDGVHVHTAANFVGSRIGVSATGTALGNGGDGIELRNNGSNVGNGTGSGQNRIAHNGGAGIRVSAGVQNRLTFNSIHANGGLGIDLAPAGVTENDPGDTDTGANQLQNFPVIAAARWNGTSTRITGTLSAAPSTAYRIDWYSSPACDTSGNGEGASWIGNSIFSTDATGDATIDTGTGLTAPAILGHVVTGVATDPAGNSSEFSDCVTITSAVEKLTSEGQCPTGTDATVLGFEDGPLSPRGALAEFYADRGLHFVDDATTTPIVYGDTTERQTHSNPNSVTNDADSPATSVGVPLTMVFDTPQGRIGFYVGNGVGSPLPTATLRAYDASGLLIGAVAETVAANDVLTFLGIRDPEARIRKVELDYGATTVSEEIDDLCFAATAPTPSAGLTLTTDVGTIGAGAREIPLSAIPSDSVPALAGPLAPAGSAPGTTPVGFTPVGFTPVGFTPVGFTPVGFTPVGFTPVGFTPVGFTPVGFTGILGTPVGFTPLSLVLASSVPIDWKPIIAGSPLEGRPTQTYTLQDVAADPVAGPRFNDVSLKSLSLDGTVLRGTRYASLLVGNKTLAQVGLDCSALTDCTGVSLAQTTVLGADIAGRIAGAGAGPRTLNQIGGGIASTPVGFTKLNALHLLDTRIADVAVSSLADPSAVVDCTLLTDCLSKTLGDAKRANAIEPEATVADIQGAIGHLSVNELVVGVLGRGGLDWESQPLDGLQSFVPSTPTVTLRLEFDVPCPLPAALSASIRPPHGFFPQVGTARVAYGNASFVELGDPSTDAATGMTWTSFPGNPCSEAVEEQQRIVVSVQTYAGFRTGSLTSRGSFAVGGAVSKVEDAAPVLVTQRGEPDETPTPIVADRLYTGHILAAGDVDRYQIPAGPEGTVTTVYLSHLDFDADLLIRKPPLPDVLSSPVGFTPVGFTQIEDRGTAVNEQQQPLPAEGLQDFPVGFTPVGFTDIASTSFNRGTATEVVQVVSDGTGPLTIDVFGYLGAHSPNQYVLRARQLPPPELPPCPARVLPFAAEATAGTLVAPADVPEGTKTLFLTLGSQLRGLYGATAANQLLAKLDASTPTSIAARPEVQGATLELDGDPDVAAALADWNANPCAGPMRLVRAVNAVVARYRAVLPGLRYLVILGSPEAFPKGWVRDPVTLGRAADYEPDLRFTTAGLTKANATYAATFKNYYETDHVYTALTRREWNGAPYFVPDLAGGRLVETPEQMGRQLDLYVARAGLLDQSTVRSLVTAYDFFLDSGSAIQGAFSPVFSAVAALVGDGWTKSQVDAAYTSNPDPPEVASLNAHFDHYRLQPAVAASAADLVETDTLAPSGTRFTGRVLWSVGCNFNHLVANTLLPSATPEQKRLLLEWPEAFFGQGGAVAIGNSSFGYGDSEALALSEQLALGLAERMGEATPMGDKFVAVLHDFAIAGGDYGDFQKKTLEQFNFNGLPHWRFSGGTPPIAPAAPPTTTDAATGLDTSTIGFAPADLQATRHDTPEGTFWSAADRATATVHYRVPQPVTTRDVTVVGLEARGVMIKALATQDIEVPDAYRSRPVIDLTAHEPEPEFGPFDALWPANFPSLRRSHAFGGARDVLTLVFGQARPTTPLSNGMIERLVGQFTGEVFYAPPGAPRSAPPVFVQTSATVSGLTARISAEVTGNPLKVEALFTQGGAWTLVALSRIAGTNVWTAPVTLPSAGPIHVLYDAVNASGAVGYTTGKGFLFTSTVSTDTAGPSISLEAPAPTKYRLGQTVRARYACSDPSIVVECAGTTAGGAPIDTGSIGDKSFSVDALDVPGNTSSRTHTYRVVHEFSGFLRPVESAPTLNVVKAGSATPVKFSLGGNHGLDILAAGYPKSAAIDCSSAAELNGIEETVTAGSSSLSYDAASDQYTYVWKSDKAWAGTCRQLVVTLADGETYRANFRFK